MKTGAIRQSAAVGDQVRSQQPASDVDVSIVIPALNAEHTIALCLESVLSQQCPLWSPEVIVVDNGCTDRTKDIAAGYGVHIEHEAHQSPGAARNRGITASCGRVVVFLDSDCVADDRWLARLLQPFFSEGVGLVGGSIAPQAPGPSLTERFLASTYYATPLHLAGTEPMALPTGNVAYLRRVLDDIGVFDAAMPGGEDCDLAWRAQAVGGYMAAYVADATVYHKHPSRPSGVFRHFRRNGVSEIVLSTLYRGRPWHGRTPGYQLRGMLRQVRALLTYLASFAIRLFRWRRWKDDRLYLVSPLLWFVIDSGSLVGKFEGLIRTRFFRRNPYATNPEEVRREPLDRTCWPARTLQDEHS